jgi:ribosomal protein S18 acetylase RimI-like enzyme
MTEALDPAGAVFEVGRVRDDRDLEQILDLQRCNLPRSLDAPTATQQGFVTVEHDLDVLRRMHELEPSIVARSGASLAGYALVMPVPCRGFVPVLEPMFQRLEGLKRRFYVMGQICVDRPWRGRGVFDSLYRAHRDHLSDRYDLVVTEVSARNSRSLRAHLRVGFRELERYRDATDDWVLLSWDWS